MPQKQLPVRKRVLKTEPKVVDGVIPLTSSDPPVSTAPATMAPKATFTTASNASTSPNPTTTTTTTLTRRSLSPPPSTSPTLPTSPTLTTAPSTSALTSCRMQRAADSLGSLCDRKFNRNYRYTSTNCTYQSKNINNIRRNKNNCNISHSISHNNIDNNNYNMYNNINNYYNNSTDSSNGNMPNDEERNLYQSENDKASVNGCNSYVTVSHEIKNAVQRQHIHHESYSHEIHEKPHPHPHHHNFHHHHHHHQAEKEEDKENEEKQQKQNQQQQQQQQQQKRQHQQQQQQFVRSLISKAFSIKTFSTLSLLCLLLLHLFEPTCADICPKVCFCQAMAKHIGCAKRGLTEIPDLIPSDTRQLSLNENLFTNKVLVRKNFSRLPNLVDLFLDGCGIEVITLDTFADLRHLSMLDLSNNKLRYIEDYTFRGLSLKHLFLNSNPGIQFAPKAFTGFRTVGLFLRKCGLHNMSQDAIRPLNGTLKMIWLNDNNFEYLPKEWYYLFKTLSHVRLENNPMHCNCELAWLYQMYVTNSSLFPEDVVLTCHTPRRLKSKAFNKLTIEDFQCQLPIFQGVDVLVGPHVGKLSCVAKADPSPTLFWERPDGTTEIYEPSEDRAVKTTEGVLFIHNHHSSTNARYKCIANNPAGNVTFTLQVTWPPTGSSTRHLVTTVPMENSLPKSHGRSSNQSAMNMTDLTADVLFTLMELIGAVIGTFLLTFLLCILVFHFFCRQQRSMGPQDRDHSEKRRTPENHYVMADIDESSIKMMEHKDLVS